jgi:hypothetical protein
MANNNREIVSARGSQCRGSPGRRGRGRRRGRPGQSPVSCPRGRRRPAWHSRCPPASSPDTSGGIGPLSVIQHARPPSGRGPWCPWPLIASVRSLRLQRLQRPGQGTGPSRGPPGLRVIAVAGRGPPSPRHRGGSRSARRGCGSPSAAAGRRSAWSASRGPSDASVDQTEARKSSCPAPRERVQRPCLRIKAAGLLREWVGDKNRLPQPGCRGRTRRPGCRFPNSLTTVVARATPCGYPVDRGNRFGSLVPRRAR